MTEPTVGDRIAELRAAEADVRSEHGERSERYRRAIAEVDPSAPNPVTAVIALAVMTVADAEQDALRAEVERLKTGLYPLGQHTIESARALAEDIGSSEDSLFVGWIRQQQRADAAVAEVTLLREKIELWQQRWKKRGGIINDLRKEVIDAWDEGFVAGSEFVPSTPAGVPLDPPHNPHRRGIW